MSKSKKNIIRLRAIEPHDIEVLYKWENDVSIWRVSNTLTPYSKHVLKQYVQNAHLDIYQTKQLRLIIELSDQSQTRPVGAIDLFDFDPFHLRAGLGILISEPGDRKNGYASKALELMIDYAFQTLQLHQLYCNITADNKASLKLFQKHGFEITGTKKDWIKSINRWEDEYLLQLIH